MCFFQNCRINICQSLKVGFISGRVIPLNANSTTHTAFVSEGTMDSDGGCTTSTFVCNNIEYKYRVETVEVINFLNLLFATHMIYFKIWLLKCFTYNYRQPSPLARLWESTTRKLTKFWLRDWFVTTLTCSSRINPAFTMANCMLLAQELDLRGIFQNLLEDF